MRKPAIIIPHDCVICGAPIERMQNEQTYFYNKRKTCPPSTGRDCRTKLKSLNGTLFNKNIKSTRPPLKNCEICGKSIPHDDDSSTRYMQRKVCRFKDSPECFGKFNKALAKAASEVMCGHSVGEKIKRSPHRKGLPVYQVKKEPRPVQQHSSDGFIKMPIPSKAEIRHRELQAHNTVIIRPVCLQSFNLSIPAGATIKYVNRLGEVL